jgi:hypothetical protein
MFRPLLSKYYGLIGKMYAPPAHMIGQQSLSSQYQPRIRREEISRNMAAHTYFNPAEDPSRVAFMDMAPINSRTDDRDVRQSQPYVAQMNTSSMNSSTMNNPYFQKYDITQDPRNVSREINGAVYEEKNIPGGRGSSESKSIMDRGFHHRWIDPNQVKIDTEHRIMGSVATRPMQSTFIKRDYSMPMQSNNNYGSGAGANATGW